MAQFSVAVKMIKSIGGIASTATRHVRVNADTTAAAMKLAENMVKSPTVKKAAAIAVKLISK